jgi:NADH-quinone oxidoreductase subunit L
LGIAIIFSVTLSVDFESIFTIIPYLLNKHIFFFSINFNILNLTSYLLFIGAIGKSAQVGLHI